MHMLIVLALVAIQCTLCPSIRVPVDWTDDSEVNRSEQLISTVKQDKPNEKRIPNEYFHYPAKKPQFVINVAEAQGVQSPEQLYKPHPIQPHTGLTKPQLGQHRIHPQKIVAQPYRGFVQIAGGSHYAKPAVTSFEVYHPYKSEEPALQQLYKDPNLDKIRNDLRDSHQKSQKYQNEVGKPDVTKNEYLERPEEIDRRKIPHKNIPTQFEVHKSQRRPVYYTYPPKQNHREHLVSQKLRHPWNQNIAKVTPIHYRPIKNHLYGLRQQHSLKFDDERNEYPQLPPQNDEEESEGYDIFQKGKEKFVQIKNNLDDSVNKVLQDRRPHDDRKLELQKDDDDDQSSEFTDEEDFVPVKNYAQVRKTEVTKHLPREAALQDAENFEEIVNAPRLREAVKSKKAQIVYSEEGYEDSAYDHAGEQKHASENEKHGGYLKQDAVSEGKYKTPSVSTKHGSKRGSKHGNEIEHDEKWNNEIKESEEEDESDYYDSEEGKSDINDITEESDENSRNKRNIEEISAKSDIIKTDINLKSLDNPNLSHERRDLSHQDINKSTILRKASNDKTIQTVTSNSNVKKKYPYYFQNLKLLSNNSPIRYAENFDLIPKKSSGGTEIYDSRSKLECPEVEDDVDVLPEKLKKEGHPDESLEDLNEEAKDEAKFSTLENKQRLKGLGDKIDCFKVKYFGENPLDSPFFEEVVIENPEPVTKPNLEIFNDLNTKKPNDDELLTQSSDIFNILDKLRKNQTDSSPRVKFFLNKTNEDSQNKAEFSSNTSPISNSENLTLAHIRNKRATPFTYEPYKIIRDSQIPESKKTTTTSNISPLIKQLQSSRVIDKVTINQDKEQALKKNSTKVYKNIGKGDRQEKSNNNSSDTFVPSFVDVNSDLRKGEPRYEIRPANHKPQYAPVENKKDKTIVDLKTQTANIESTTQSQLKRSKRRKPTIKPYFDVSQFLPKNIDTAASNTVRRIIRTTTAIPTTERIKRHQVRQSDSSEKEYNGYNNKEDNKIKTTTTQKPSIKKRIRGTTTTPTSVEVGDDTESPKLRLVTRFRGYEPNEEILTDYDTTDTPSIIKYDNERSSPKYTEKKKKSTKSTLVTDTKSYGVGDDVDMRKEEVDDLIGVKHDTDGYIPLYERVVNKINRMKNEDLNKEREQSFDSEVNIYGDNTTEDPFHFPDDEDEEDEDDDDNDGGKNEDIDDDGEDDEVEEKDEEEEMEGDTDNKEINLELTTSEPTKRTLAKTTEAPATTTESRSAKLQLKPIISKKKVEIHKELPVNKSSPHVTQFKQDIKEIEIVKELTPKLKKKSNKNVEALDLFRDEKLAEEVNKLGDVEVFRENLDLNSGPKHGGNYRSITSEELDKESRNVNNKGDVETSQTETKKFIEVNKEIPPRRRGSYTSRGSPQKNDRERSAKFVELHETYDPKPRLHGGNLKLPQSRGSRRNSKSERYVEIDEDEEEEPSNMHGGNLKPYGNSRNSGRRMHGGNYRSAKLVEAGESEEKPAQTRNKSRGNPAASLSGYARAAPDITTTPGYILDPSKRMYYFVDA